MTRATMLAVTAVAAVLVAGCAGNGTQIADGKRCDTWLDGNGRDRYLAAHGLPEYDAGTTGRRPDTAVQVGARMDRYCKDNPNLLIDEALRLAASGGAAAEPPAPPADRVPSTTETGKRKKKTQP